MNLCVLVIWGFLSYLLRVNLGLDGEGEVVRAWAGRYAPEGARHGVLDLTASQTFGNLQITQG